MLQTEQLATKGGGKCEFAAVRHEVKRIVKADVGLFDFQNYLIEQGSSGKRKLAAIT